MSQTWRIPVCPECGETPNPHTPLWRPLPSGVWTHCHGDRPPRYVGAVDTLVVAVPAEPQGEVVAALAKALGWDLDDPDAEPGEVRRNVEKILAAITPLLALEVKERLEGFLASPAFLDHLRAGGKRRRDVLDAFFGAFTHAPSEPEEGSK